MRKMDKLLIMFRPFDFCQPYKRRIVWLAGRSAALALAFITMAGAIAAQKDPSPSFSDEFTGARGQTFDLKKWTAEVGGGGWGNDELQYYRDGTANARLDGKGHLVITAEKLNPARKLTCWYGRCLYTSARLITKNKFEFKYGRIEARIKLPAGAGVWPAFWMLGNDIDRVGWPSCGEIDVMEFIGREPSKIYGSIHGPGYSGDKAVSGSISIAEGRAGDFHIYAVEWSENEIRWFFDGKEYHKFSRTNVPTGSKWVFDHPFFIIINFAVGGKWPGSPDLKTRFPQSMVVDYIRVAAR